MRLYCRLSPDHCSDSLRWLTLGMSEAAFWSAFVLAVQSPKAGGVNRQLRLLGLSERDARDLVNPGFYDPFSVHDVTLDNPRYQLLGMHMMAGTLRPCWRLVLHACIITCIAHQLLQAALGNCCEPRLSVVAQDYASKGVGFGPAVPVGRTCALHYVLVGAT
jgi:hypothetical protein